MTPPNSRVTPALIFVAVLAGAQFIAGGSALLEFIPAEVVGLIVLVLGGIQLAGSIVLKGQVTPWVDVVAKRSPGGVIVAGPAARAETGTVVAADEDGLDGSVSGV